VSFILGVTLNQFDSFGKRQNVTAPSSNSAFITDSLYVSTDSASTLLTAYVQGAQVSNFAIAGG